jgi:predicted DNA-binding protein
MKLTVDEMSRISSYVMAEHPVEKYLEDNSVPADRVEAVEDYYDLIENDFNNLKPGQQMTIPSDWS